MRRTRVGAAAVAALLVVMVAVPGSAGADSRIPVSSVDDATSPVANRIAAVTNIISATNARLARVITAYPPNSCTEFCPVADGFIAALSAYNALGESVAEACASEGGPSDGLGASVIADADAFAADTSATGIANQPASIATVLGNADDRLGGIRVPDSGPPESPEAAALNALSVVVSEGGNAAGGWLGASFDYPPNPCAVDG